MLEHVRLMHDYHQWATARIWEAMASLPADDFVKEVSGGSLKDVTDHIIAADNGWWLQLTSGKWPDGALDLPDAIPDYIERWKRLESDIASFIGALDDEHAGQYLDYPHPNGNEYSTRIDMVVIHVFNHATYHRGQFALRLRALGHQPPRTDLIAKLWEAAESS